MRKPIIKEHDCNNCARVCKGDIVRRGQNVEKVLDCPGQMTPRGTFSLAELAIAYPQGLHDALSALPFRTFTLKELL